MKRKRSETMEKGGNIMMKSEIKAAIEELSMFMMSKTNKNPSRSDDDDDSASVGGDACFIHTRPFLSVCGLLVQVLDKIGPTMAVLRQDIDLNIQRMEKQCDTDPEKYSNLVEIVKNEAEAGNARKGNSCSRALVWLTRSLDFVVNLLERLVKDPCLDMEQVVEESYNISLKPWHGWISSAAFKIALKLVPDAKTFTDILVTKGENIETLKEDVHVLISLLAPMLEDIHSTLRLYRLDRLKST